MTLGLTAVSTRGATSGCPWPPQGEFGTLERRSCIPLACRAESFRDWNLPNCIKVFADGFSLVRTAALVGSGRMLLFWKREVAN